MGEIERLDLREYMQIIIHQMSVLTNQAYSTGWTLKGYDEDSWKRSYDYFKIPLLSAKEEFVNKLKEMKANKKE